MSSENRLLELEQRLELLAEENQRLAAEVSTLRGNPVPRGSVAVLDRPKSPDPVEEVAEAGPDGAAVLDRRRALRSLGGLAAASVGLLAAGGAIRPAPANAEAFSALIIGEAQTGAQHSTRLTATPSNSDPFSAATFSARNTGDAATGRRVGLFGSSTSRGVGVYGEGLNGDSSYPSFGVQGTTNAPVGDFSAVAAAGVYGTSTNNNGIGVYGRSNGTAVYAQGGDSTSAGVALRAEAPLGTAVLLGNSAVTFPPSHSTWTRGSLVHRNGELWFCTLGGTGTASRWTPLSSNNLITLEAPARVYDSRPGNAPTSGVQATLKPGEIRTIDVIETGSVPATAKAILANVTAAPISGSGRGFLTTWKEGQTQPNASTLNFNGGVPTAFPNSATIALNAGKLNATVGGQATVEIDLILDVVGYYL